MDFQVDENEIYSGKVVYFKQKEGYGFIRPEIVEIDGDIYVHYTEIEKGKAGFKNLLTGDTVTFKLVENGITPDQKKKYRALDLNIVRTLGA
jgi:cold shock CspA family protein